MIRTVSRQRGISAIGLLSGLLALVAVVTLVLRLGPHYIDWQAMKSVIGDLPPSEVHTMSKSEIRETLQKRFRINSLRDFDLREILAIERQKTGTTLSINYERRESIVANADVVLTFSDKFYYK